MRTREELQTELKEQHRALVVHGASYDAGEKWQAKSLATTVYTLVHDGGRNSRSLLGQLDLKRQPEFISTSRGISNEHMSPDRSEFVELIPPTPLLMISINENNVTYIPPCQLGMDIPWLRQLKFSKWYTEPIFKNSKGRNFSRENLIHTIRSRDGGAHFDALIDDEAYKNFASDAAPEMRVGGKPLPNAHFASMRQLAWELEKTIDSFLANINSVGGEL